MGGGEFLGGYHREGAVEVVDGFHEVFGEFLNGEVAGGGHVALGAFLQVTKFGDLAEVFVLEIF